MAASTYQVPLPPPVVDGKFLSASWVNQLGEYVNNTGNFLFGANIPFWVNPLPGSMNVNSLAGMYSLQHKYDKFIVEVDSVYHNLDLWVRFSKKDDYTDLTNVFYYKFPDGLSSQTFTIDHNTFPLDDDEIYFAYVQTTKEHDGNVFIRRFGEVGEGLISTPPTIPILTATDIIDADYLNGLRSAAYAIGQYSYPTNLPFVAVASKYSYSGEGTSYRWQIKHIHKYLKFGFLRAMNGSKIYMYLDGQLVQEWDNSGFTREYVIFDMENLPNGIAEPTIGSNYDIHLTVGTSSLFRTLYLWESPYQ